MRSCSKAEVLGPLQQQAANAAAAEIGAGRDGIEPGDAAALAKQDDRIAGHPAIAFGDQRFGGLALDQQAKGSAGDAVAGENGVFDGGEVIDVRRAGRANLGRHAGCRTSVGWWKCPCRKRR